MLLTRQKQQQTGPQLNMAAMVDVVFLLLIFFMCTSSISRLESSLSSQVSRLGPGSGQELEELPPYIIRLERAGEGVLVWLEDRPCATFDDLHDRLRETYNRGPDVPVLIRSQARVPYGYVVAALDACRKAGFQTVAFSTRGENS
ncbi:MAG: ExbD/TolR family protein, partial [Planctomycetota bacterium]|jgi:biopolymer transport protein ExbD